MHNGWATAGVILYLFGMLMSCLLYTSPLDCEGKSYSGKYLMEHGLEMPYVHEVDWGKKNDWSARVLYLEAE